MSDETDALFRELQPAIDALITERIIEFHRALVERGQIRQPLPSSGVPTGDCTGDQDRPSNPSQPQVEIKELGQTRMMSPAVFLSGSWRQPQPRTPSDEIAALRQEEARQEDVCAEADRLARDVLAIDPGYVVLTALPPGSWSYLTRGWRGARRLNVSTRFEMPPLPEKGCEVALSLGAARALLAARS